MSCWSRTKIESTSKCFIRRRLGAGKPLFFSLHLYRMYRTLGARMLQSFYRGTRRVGSQKTLIQMGGRSRSKGVAPRLRTPIETTSVMIVAMRSEWLKAIAVVALVIMLVGIAVPDASSDDDPTLASASTTVSTAHSGNQPFGCQHEEDCFCCAHIAPTAQVVLPSLILSTEIQQEVSVTVVSSIPSPPYHPPRA